MPEVPYDEAEVPVPPEAVPTEPGTPEAGTPEAAAPEASAGSHVDADWRRVSPKYVVVEVIGSIIGEAILVGAMLVVHFVFGQQWALWVAIAAAVLGIVSIAFEPRRVRSIAYRLREDDLVFRRGIMYQRQVAVPYGRMQLVDITRGPLARAMGLADLKFVTAAAATAVTVPGLPAEEADRLRDELVALAETRRAGL
ncbi:PH domain-containing protein [Agromyces sp. CFH 90414]|uniref:PH domain-containing protein n=1 Tax=Agromyces agglutinans TaxID=2662258 RepID=A0A6I2FE27_9MICO|nr:PH domain-containing protein [Agromyces agglutinans]MRG60143.1 PH domain-containing protein [Agromyces agglutinans]